MRSSPRVLWECFASADAAVVRKTGEVAMKGLTSRPELNGEIVKLVHWDGISGRFETSSHLKAKPHNLEAVPLLSDASSPVLLTASVRHREPSLGPLPPDLALAVARFLRVREVASAAGSSHGVRAALWSSGDALPLWDGLLIRRFGCHAAEVVLRARPLVRGPVLYRAARALRQLWRSCLEVVQGSIADCIDGCEVVACPVARLLPRLGFHVGAQGAILRAGGEALEREVNLLQRPLDELSVTLVNGGDLCPRVALTVTEPPESLVARFQDTRLQQQADLRDNIASGLLDYVATLHRNLLMAVRQAGFRSVAMPTLCTGGVGMPPLLVALAAVKVVHQDRKSVV